MTKTEVPVMQEVLEALALNPALMAHVTGLERDLRHSRETIKALEGIITRQMATIKKLAKPEPTT